MTPLDLLARLHDEGVSASLKLRLDGDTQPLPETIELLELHRDDLIIHLATAQSDTPQMCRLSEELRTDSVWCRCCWRYHTRACSPTDKLYEAKLSYVKVER